MTPARSTIATRADANGPAPHDVAPMQHIEQHLQALAQSLGARDLPAIEQHAAELQRALAQSLERLRQAARRDTSGELKRRVELVNAQVAAQRDALVRATAALERAFHVLVPTADAAVYSPGGLQAPRRGTSALQA